MSYMRSLGERRERELERDEREKGCKPPFFFFANLGTLERRGRARAWPGSRSFHSLTWERAGARRRALEHASTLERRELCSSMASWLIYIYLHLFTLRSPIFNLTIFNLFEFNIRLSPKSGLLIPWKCLNYIALQGGIGSRLRTSAGSDRKRYLHSAFFWPEYYII